METIWLEPRENAIMIVAFKASRRTLAGVFRVSNGGLYFAFTKSVAAALKDVLLSTPYIDSNRKAILVFKDESRARKAVGYRLTVSEDSYGFKLFLELVRLTIWATRQIQVRVVDLRAGSPSMQEQAAAEEKPEAREPLVYEVYIESSSVDEGDEGEGSGR